MISINLNSLFSLKFRKLLIFCFAIIGFIFLAMLPHINDDKYRIIMLYLVNACVMLLIILYKNSLNKFGICIFCFLCVQLFTLAPNPDNMPLLMSSGYVLSFRYGVSSRSFIPTIVDFFSGGGFISKYFVWHFIFSAKILYSFIISVFLGFVIDKETNNVKMFLILLSLLYLSSFTAPYGYFIPGHFGVFEMYALFVVFFALVIMNKPLIRWIMPLMALITMAIHINLVFFYIPLIIVLLMYGVLEKPGKNNKSIPLLIITIITIGSAFLLYYLFRERTFVFKDVSDFFEYLSAKSDLYFTVELLSGLMFSSLQDHLDYYVAYFNSTNRAILRVLINIPILLCFIFFWIKCFCLENMKSMKVFFLLPICILIYQAPVFFIFIDYARWMIMILNVQFVLLFYLIYVKNTTVLTIVNVVTPYIRNNIFFVILLFLIMMYLGAVQAMSSQTGEGSFNNVRDILGIFLNFFS